MILGIGVWELIIITVTVQSFSHVLLFATPWTTACQVPCPSPTPGVHPNPCPPCRWCHPTISSSVIPFSSGLQSFPASGSFPWSQFFASGGQRIGVSAFFPMNIQDWFPLGLTGLISCSPRDSQESSLTAHFKSISSSVLSFLYGPTLTSLHDYWKTIALTIWTFISKFFSIHGDIFERQKWWMLG